MACAVVIGSVSDEQASAPVEETTVEEPTAIEEPTMPMPGESTRPAPTTPREKIIRNVEDAVGYDPEFADDTPRPDVQVTQRDAAGCRYVQVFYEDLGPLFGSTLGNIQSTMGNIYEGIYSERGLRAQVCNAKIDASGILTDNRGNETQETIYSTSMDRATADTINWSNSSAVEFPTLWRLEYISPALERQNAEEAVDQAVDCADDGGLFDFDFAECP